MPFFRQDKTVGDHSGLILAARTTLPHFSVSPAISLPNSAGEPVTPNDPVADLQTGLSLEPALAPSLQVPLHWAWRVGHVLLDPCERNIGLKVSQPFEFLPCLVEAAGLG